MENQEPMKTGSAITSYPVAEMCDGCGFLAKPEIFLRTGHYAWLESLKEEPVWAMTLSTDLSRVDRRSSKAKSAGINLRYDGGLGMPAGSCGKVRVIAA